MGDGNVTELYALKAEAEPVPSIPEIYDSRLSLVEILRIGQPILPDRSKLHAQLRYIEGYVRTLGCQAILIERVYIDRDFMDDHDVFYSRGLRSYRNTCQRVHFFTVDPQTLRECVEAFGCAKPTKESAISLADLNSSYLGFSVIKPLPGCPVGRTVLRSYPPNKEDGCLRVFGCLHRSTVHVAGLELSIEGLAFQQQDLCVSACATTALWSALQKYGSLETTAAVTSAQVTNLATRNSLPFGRPMPSEGLSVDQMCQVVNSLGIAPLLLRVSSKESAIESIYSVVRSGFPAVLILRDILKPHDAHAVAVAGLKIDPSQNGAPDPLYVSPARKVRSIYIHDDRHGPYLRADLSSEEMFTVDIQTTPDKTEPWRVSHILVPMHPRVKLSFATLQYAVCKISQLIGDYYENTGQVPSELEVEAWLVRPHTYLSELRSRDGGPSVAHLRSLIHSTNFPRYVAVLRFSATYLGTIDVLLDTTSSIPNLCAISIVVLDTTGKYSSEIAQLLTKELQVGIAGA